MSVQILFGAKLLNICENAKVIRELSNFFKLKSSFLGIKISGK